MTATTQSIPQQSAELPYEFARKAELRAEIDQLRACIDANEGRLRELRIRAPIVFVDIGSSLIRRGMNFEPRSTEEGELLALLDERGALADRWNRTLEEFAALS